MKFWVSNIYKVFIFTLVIISSNCQLYDKSFDNNDNLQNIDLNNKKRQSNIKKQSITEIIEKYNYTLYEEICDDKYEFEKCQQKSSLILSEININNFTEINGLSIKEKEILSSIYYNLGNIYYHGYTGTNSPNLIKGMENILISSYLGNSKSHYLLYILIENELIDQIIYTKEFLKLIENHPILNEISKTKFYKNFNYAKYLDKNLVSNSSRILKSSIALSFLFSSSLSHYPPSLNTMANKYINGYGVPKSCETSIKFYKECSYETIKQITDKHSRNLYKYVSLETYEYVEKKFITKIPNEKEEIEFYRVKASNGDIEYIQKIASKYLFGDGVKQDFKESFKWYEHGYKLNDSKCTYHLGEQYLNGWGVEKNYAKALELLTQASRLNYSKSYNSLGYMYYYGYGVEKDLKKAYDYFRIAIKEKDDDGYYDLVTMLLENKDDQIKTDFSLAYQYSNVLAASAHTYGSYFFAMMSHYNIGSIVNLCDVNIQFFKSVAEKNENCKNRFELALKYYYEQKYRSSLLLFIELAEEGLRYAQLNAALLLKNYDIFIDKDYQKYLTVKYTKMAANSDNIYATLLLGDFYFNGYGNIKIDYEKALYYYKKIIQSQSASTFLKEHATFMIGMMNSFGLGMEKNLTKALSFYNATLKSNSAAKYPSSIMIKYDELINNGTFWDTTRSIAGKFLIKLVSPKWKVWIYVGFILFYLMFFLSLKFQSD